VESDETPAPYFDVTMPHRMIANTARAERKIQNVFFESV